MSQRVKIIVITLLLLVSLALSFGAGYTLGILKPVDYGRGIGSVVEAWDIIVEEYVEKDRIDVDSLAEAAIRGMVEALEDPYTAYLDPEAYELSLADIEGRYEGIGAAVGVREGQITIIAPFADSPAAAAGIKAGDIILEIDDRPTSGMSLAEAAAFVRGPRGTTVRLLILHQGETEPEEIEVVRDEILLTSVHFEMMGDIAYINITRFTEQTNDELSPVLLSVGQQEARGIILDLRSNPGGLLGAVIDVASRFLSDGVVLTVVDNEGGRETHQVTYQEVTTGLPMVVLVDGFSASGSEVLAGALQDHARAIVAGTTTFGKGSVNKLYQLQDGSGLYITIARWYTPGGRLIEGQGIVPDYELELTGEDLINWALDYLMGSSP